MTRTQARAPTNSLISSIRGNDDAKLRKFALVAGILKRRIELLASLPLVTLEKLALQKKVRDIGHV